MKVLFLQSAHYADDDRVWYHQRAALSEAGCEVDVCGKEELQDEGRLAAIADQADDYQVIIVDTPRALWAVRKAKHAKLVYDITEWYPALSSLNQIGWRKYLKAPLMFLAKLWAGFRVDAFVFGEYYKSSLFRLLFPYKSALTLPYYPDLGYFTPPVKYQSYFTTCRLLYTGSLTAEKGWWNTIAAIRLTQHKLPHIHIILDVISKEVPHIPNSNIEINHLAYMPFRAFCKRLALYDVFIDLRQTDSQNNKSLPIKLFYYMAYGRPVIYTDMRGIRKGVPEIEQFGFLVASVSEASNALCSYLQKPSLYEKHCQKARELSVTKYNWNSIKDGFTGFITSVCD